MRCIGIIGAMEVEVASLKEQMKDIQVTRKASMEFYSGIIEGKNVVVVRSGIGKVNAAVCTQILIDDFKAEVVINRKSECRHQHWRYRCFHRSDPS